MTNTNVNNVLMITSRSVCVSSLIHCGNFGIYGFECQSTNRALSQSWHSYRNRQQQTVYQYYHRNASFEHNVLRNIVHERPEFTSIWSRRQVQRLRNLQSFLQIAPAPLINCEQSGALVFRVVGNDDANEQRQTNHAAQENVDVYVDGVYLRRLSKRK